MPAIHEGKTVICDRFIDSSLAYQGFARGLGIDEVLSINQFAIENVYPDLTLYLDVDPELGLRRIRENENREINRLDLESISFHDKVRKGYLEVKRRFPDRIVWIDANRTLEAVFGEVTDVLEQFLARQE